MILYNYQCPVCDTETESWCAMELRNEPILCPECDSLAHRVISPVRNTLMTRNFNDDGFPTAYERWADQRAKRVKKELARET